MMQSKNGQQSFLKTNLDKHENKMTAKLDAIDLPIESKAAANTSLPQWGLTPE